MINHLLGAAALFFFGIFALPFIVHAAMKCRLSNETGLPVIGGLALYALWVLGVAYNVPFEQELTVLFFSTTLLTLLGLYCDISPLPMSYTVFGVVFALLPTLKARFFLSHSIVSPVVMAIYSLAWAVMVIGGFSFLDYIPGLALTVAISTGIGFLTIASMMGDTVLAATILFFLISLSIVLLHSSHPTKIALGRSGTFLIGGFYALVSFLIEWEEIRPWGILVPSLILILPLLEVGLQYVAFSRSEKKQYIAAFLISQKWHSAAIMLTLFLACIVLNMLSLFFLHYVISLPLYIISVAILIGCFALVLFFQRRAIAKSEHLYPRK